MEDSQNLPNETQMSFPQMSVDIPPKDEQKGPPWPWCPLIPRQALSVLHQ